MGQENDTDFVLITHDGLDGLDEAVSRGTIEPLPEAPVAVTTLADMRTYTALT